MLVLAVGPPPLPGCPLPGSYGDSEGSDGEDSNSFQRLVNKKLESLALDAILARVQILILDLPAL
jgi:hypothetical protein